VHTKERKFIILYKFYAATSSSKKLCQKNSWMEDLTGSSLQ